VAILAREIVDYKWLRWVSISVGFKREGYSSQTNNWTYVNLNSFNIRGLTFLNDCCGHNRPFISTNNLNEQQQGFIYESSNNKYGKANGDSVSGIASFYVSGCLLG
jgi:hypothetical protein